LHARLRQTIEAIPNSHSTLGFCTRLYFRIGRHCFEQCHANLRFSGGNHIRPRLLQRSGVTQMGASHQHSQVGIQQPRLPNNLSSIFNIGAQNETPRSHQASFLERSRTENIAKQGGDALGFQVSHCLEVEVDDCDV